MFKMPNEIERQLEVNAESYSKKEGVSEEIVAANIERSRFDINKILIIFLLVVILGIVGAVLFILKPWESGFSFSEIRALF